MEMKDKPLSEWTLREVREECVERMLAAGDCRECLLSGICKLTPDAWRLEKPRLTDEELAICRALGARWVSRDSGECSDEVADVWFNKPERDGPIYRAGKEDSLAIVKAYLFPSLRPGDLAEVSEEKP